MILRKPFLAILIVVVVAALSLPCFAATGYLATYPYFRATDTSGKPLSGGKVYSYAAGTSSRNTTYSDYSIQTANSWPVVLGSTGEAAIYLKTPTKLRWFDKNGVFIGEMDNVGLVAGDIVSVTGTAPIGVTVGQNPVISLSNTPQWYGAKADDTTDDTVAIQAAIDAAIAAGGTEVFLPAGTYKITDTIKLGYGDKYAGFTLRGAGSTTAAGYGTRIDASSFGDRPAINFQGSRRTTLKDLIVVGKNVAPVTAASTLDPTMANWITSGCSNTQYAPYAGISVGAYTGTKPSGGYSNDVYGRYDCSEMVLDNVVVWGFTVGLMVAPCNASTDNDAITLRDCSFFYNTFAYSCGGSQSRSIIFQNTGVCGNWCCFTTLRHGQQIGNAPSIYGGIWQLAHKVFELGSANGGNSQVVSGVQAESFGWLGELGVADSGASIPMVFSGCQFGFSGSAYRPYFLVAHRKVKFDSCLLQAVDDGSGALYALNFGASNYYGLVQFDGCNFIGLADSNNVFVGSRDFLFTSQSFKGCSAESWGYTDTGALGSRCSLNRDVDIDGTSWTNSITRYLIGHNVANVNIQGKPYKLDRLNDSGWNSVGFSISNLVLSGTTHGSTLTFTAGTTAEFRVGDLIQWKVWEPYAGNVVYNMVPAFRVTINNAGAVTAVALFDGLDGTYAPASLYVLTPFFVNSTESTGATHTNTTVDSVTTIANWKIGDFIRGAGIAVNTRIANISGTTITLSKAATATASGVALYNCRLTSY